MSAVDFLTSLGQALLDALDPLRRAIASPTEMNALLHREGWRVPPDSSYFSDLAAALALGGDVESVAASLEQLADGGFTLDDVKAVLDATAKLLHDLAAAPRPTRPSLPSPLDRDDFWADFPTDLAQDLVVTYLEKAHPALFMPLHLLGVLDEQMVAPPAGDSVRLPYRQRRLRWDRLATMASEPGSLVRDVYGWGGSFDHGQLLIRLETALRALGLLVGRQSPAGELAQRYYPGAAPNDLRLLRVTLLRERRAAGGVEFGLVGLPVPPADGGAPDGLFVGPSVEGAAGAELPLDGPFSLRLAGGLESTGIVGIEIHPGQATARLDAAAATIDVAATLIAKPASPWILIGNAESDRIEGTEFELGIELAGPVADLELKLRLHTDGIQLFVDLSDGDSFVTGACGSDPKSATVSGNLVWSSKTGLHVEGQAGLNLVVPLHTAVGPVTIQQIRIAVTSASGGLTLTAAVSLGAVIGPVQAAVSDIGVTCTLMPVTAPARGTFGDLDVQFGFKPPSGLGVALDAQGLLTGGGYLAHAGDEYAGALELSVSGVLVKAYGLVQTVLPGGQSGYSFIAVISTEFLPAIELPFGFSLDGVGGLVGIHRSISQSAIETALWAGHLDGLLFPKNPVASAPQLLSALDTYFPAAPGRYVVGPLIKIGWSANLVVGELAVLFELPEPLKILLIGDISVNAPTAKPVLVLHISFDGGIDFGAKTAFFDASLHDSKIAGYPITGDLAFRYGWGDNAVFALALGGFNPQFQPPASFPTLKRLAISISSSVAKLDTQAYLALTSNTLQFGARVELTAGTGGFNVHGWLGFDALFEKDPLSFEFDLSAGVDLRSGSSVLASVHLDGKLSGPTPWHISGDASLSLLFFDVSVHFDKTWGDSAGPAALPDPLTALTAALADRSAWSGLAAPGVRAAISPVGTPSDAGNAVLLDPAGGLRIAQRAVPLDQPITRFGGVSLGRTATFSVAPPAASGPPSATTEEFAPAQFLDLTDAEKLSLPSFSRFNAGVEVGTNAVSLGQTTGRSQAVLTKIAYDTKIIDSIPAADPPDYRLGLAEALTLNGGIGRLAPGLGRYAPAPGTPPRVTLAADQWVVASTADLAHQADITSDGTKLGAHLALQRYLAANPGETGGLQIVLASEAG